MPCQTLDFFASAIRNLVRGNDRTQRGRRRPPPGPILDWTRAPNILGLLTRTGSHSLFEHCSWFNQPVDWSLAGEELRVVTDANTDFWRETYYGFTRDSGHFFGANAVGDFTAQVRVRATYEQLYDQAGLMLRVDPATWVKAGIELSDGHSLLSTVLTVGQSDWTVGTYAGNPDDFWLRVTLAAGVLRLQVSPDGQSWPLLRLAPFPWAECYQIGPMRCTPERAGLKVRFSEFHVGPPLNKGLHDLT